MSTTSPSPVPAPGPAPTVAYLSSAWIDAADALLSTSLVDPPVPPPGFTIETVVLDDADPTVSRGYVIELSGASMHARPRRSGESTTVRFTQSYSVAAAVARGEVSAQAAFLAADIQLGGDVGTLIGQSGLIGQIGDALGPLRSATEYPG